MKRFAALYGGSAQHHRTLFDPKFRRWLSDVIYLLDLSSVDLRRFDGLVLPDQLHIARMKAAREQILELLSEGKTVVAFGPQPDPWLPGVVWENRPTNFWWWKEGGKSGVEIAMPEHSLFERLGPRDVTWHFHGVFHPPEGAETLIASEDGKALMYIDRASTPGTMIVTCLDPFYHYGSYFMPATERFLTGFLPWLVEAEVDR